MTATKISVPSISDNSEIITITGTKEGIEKAEHEIRVCSEEQVCLLFAECMISVKWCNDLTKIKFKCIFNSHVRHWNV